MKKLFTFLLLFMGMCINIKTAPSALRLTTYAAGTTCCFFAVHSERIIPRIVCSGLYLFFAYGIAEHDGQIYQNFLNATRNITTAYDHFNNEIVKKLKEFERRFNDIKDHSALQNIYGDHLSHYAGCFEAKLKENSPENLGQYRTTTFFSNDFKFSTSCKDGEPIKDHQTNQYRATRRYEFYLDGHYYDPLEKKQEALKLLPEPTAKYKKQYQQSKYICTSLPFICLATSAAFAMFRKK